jgi:multidrug efflux system outer membrane protein
MICFRNFISLIVVLSLSFLGCSRKVIEITSPVENMETFSDGGEVTVPEEWWHAFDDEELNSLVETALESNPDLMTVWYRLTESRAIEARAASGFFPSLNATVEAGTGAESNSIRNEQFLLGLYAEYEIDLWGRIQSAVDAERFRARASLFDYQSAAISLTANIVGAWFQLIEAGQQVEIATRQVENNTHTLDLIISRYGSGQVRRVDILRQEQLLEATREQKIHAEERFQTIQHQLAVLLGQPPRNNTEMPVNMQLPRLPMLPETGLPVELIQRRPDIQSALEMVRAADRDMASSISNQYPRLSLSASLTSSSDNANDLFDNWMRSFAGNLFAPIFYGGQRRADVDRARAIKNQRLYAYGQTVLTAFREVEDALVREKKQQQSIESIQKQLELAREAREQIQVSYYNGIGDYLDVLTALDEEQQLQRDLVRQRRMLLEYRIALYRALAGGFETPLEVQNE